LNWGSNLEKKEKYKRIIIKRGNHPLGRNHHFRPKTPARSAHPLCFARPDQPLALAVRRMCHARTSLALISGPMLPCVAAMWGLDVRNLFSLPYPLFCWACRIPPPHKQSPRNSRRILRCNHLLVVGTHPVGDLGVVHIYTCPGTFPLITAG
jgi:hypothetical protein